MEITLLDIGKFSLYIGIAVSVVGISIQIMRLLSTVNDNARDLRKTVQNMGVLSDKLIEDHEILRKGLEGFSETAKKLKTTVNDFSDSISGPLKTISKFVGGIATFVSAIQKRFNK